MSKPKKSAPKSALKPARKTTIRIVKRVRIKEPEKPYDLAAFKNMESVAADRTRRGDFLVRRPTRRIRYVNDDGSTAKFSRRFEFGQPSKRTRAHTKVTAAKRKRLDTTMLERWVQGIDPSVNVPIAGISKDSREEDLRIKALQPKPPRKTKARKGRASKAKPGTGKDSPQTDLQTNAGVSMDCFAVSACPA